MKKEELEKIMNIIHMHFYHEELGGGSFHDLCERNSANAEANRKAEGLQDKIMKAFKQDIICKECDHKFACTKTDSACDHFRELDLKIDKDDKNELK